MSAAALDREPVGARVMPDGASDAPALRLTVSAAYRSGSEVLLADSGPLPDLGAVCTALSEIDDQLDTHADLLFERGAELVVRVAERRFKRDWEPTPRPQKRADRGVKF
jgi:hypothetical protein